MIIRRKQQPLERATHPGDVAAWPAGAPNAHQVMNRSDTPCSYLICGTRMPRDVVHYPDLGGRVT